MSRVIESAVDALVFKSRGVAEARPVKGTAAKQRSMDAVDNGLGNFRDELEQVVNGGDASRLQKAIDSSKNVPPKGAALIKRVRAALNKLEDVYAELDSLAEESDELTDELRRED